MSRIQLKTPHKSSYYGILVAHGPLDFSGQAALHFWPAEPMIYLSLGILPFLFLKFKICFQIDDFWVNISTPFWILKHLRCFSRHFKGINKPLKCIIKHLPRKYTRNWHFLVFSEIILTKAGNKSN